MKMNLFTSFNKPDTTVVITSFPNPKDGTKGDKGFNAVGWHSQKTLVELSKSAPVLVLAEKRDQNSKIRNQESGKHVIARSETTKQSHKDRHALRARDDKTQTLRVNDNLTVLRAWGKGNLFSLFSLISLISQMKKVSSVFVQFEFNVFGGIVPNLILLLVLSLLNLTGKRITFELHQVITDVGLLKKHVPISNPLLQTFFNLGLRVFYTLLGMIAHDIVVFEEALKTRLSKFIKTQKIHTLSLSVEKKTAISKQYARKKVNKSLRNCHPEFSSGSRKNFGTTSKMLKQASPPASQSVAARVQHDKNVRTIKNDEFVVLVFGFINGYKGIDWITKALKDTPMLSSSTKAAGRMEKLVGTTSKSSRLAKARSNNKKVRLLIAGGMNPYLKNQPYYKKLYTSIVTEIKKHPHMTYSGFVPDEDVAAYFSAADVVVLPYEVFMSASGPFSLALSYKKPVFLSDKLLPYGASSDMKQSLKEAGLKKSDIFFKLNKTELIQKLSNLQTKNTYEKHVTFSDTLASKRESKNVVRKLHTILHPSLRLDSPASRRSSGPSAAIPSLTQARIAKVEVAQS